MANGKELDILFKASKINKSFGDFQANIDIDISIKKGEIHALLGENGAGKSTLVKIFYGVLKPDSGTIEINNQLVSISSPKSARTNGVGMVFQHFSLFPALTVAENILIALDQKISFQRLISDIRKLSKEWDLFIDPLRLISDLSVGERQRVEIIRCLMQNPKLLIMDEPTSVLTPQEIENLFKILKRLSKSGCSILYISHKLEEIIEEKPEEEMITEEIIKEAKEEMPEEIIEEAPEQMAEETKEEEVIEEAPKETTEEAPKEEVKTKVPAPAMDVPAVPTPILQEPVASNNTFPSTDSISNLDVKASPLAKN